MQKIKSRSFLKFDFEIFKGENTTKQKQHKSKQTFKVQHSFPSCVTLGNFLVLSVLFADISPGSVASKKQSNIY